MPSPDAQSTQKSAAAGFDPVELISGDREQGLILICDHARNLLPEAYAHLGLGADELGRHIAYDIGAGELTRRLAVKLGVPAVLSRFSRLLIDPNRGEDDPTLIMRISDGTPVPGNRHVDADERARRISLYYRPYHDAVARLIDEMLAEGTAPAILSIHSFTAVWRGQARPWHAGILWDQDPRLAVPLIEALREIDGLVVGDNEPYSGKLRGDTMFRHGTGRGLAHALLEVRQDLIGDDRGVNEWAGRLSGICERLCRLPGLHSIENFGSDTN